MPRTLALPLILVLLTACDAGHRDDPGADNRTPGPQLAITTPASNQVFPVAEFVDEVDAAGKVIGKRRTYRLPTLMFDLRNLRPADQTEGDHVRFVLDRGPVQVWEDWRKPLPLGDTPQPSGTHVIRAWVSRGDGTPYTNPEAATVRRFHLGQEKGEFASVAIEGGEHPLGPFREHDPHLILVAPGPTGTADTVLFTVSGARLDGKRFRVRAEIGDKTLPLHSAAPLSLNGNPALEGVTGTQTMVMTLEQKAIGKDAPWKPVPGPFNREERKVDVR